MVNEYFHQVSSSFETAQCILFPILFTPIISQNCHHCKAPRLLCSINAISSPSCVFKLQNPIVLHCLISPLKNWDVGTSGHFEDFRPGFGKWHISHVDRHGQFTLKQLRLSLVNEMPTNSYTGPRLPINERVNIQEPMEATICCIATNMSISPQSMYLQRIILKENQYKCDEWVSRGLAETCAAENCMAAWLCGYSVM